MFAQDHNSDNAEPDPCLDRIFVKVPDELSREDVTKIFSVSISMRLKQNLTCNSRTGDKISCSYVNIHLM